MLTLREFGCTKEACASGIKNINFGFTLRRRMCQHTHYFFWARGVLCLARFYARLLWLRGGTCWLADFRLADFWLAETLSSRRAVIHHLIPAGVQNPSVFRYGVLPWGRSLKGKFLRWAINAWKQRVTNDAAADVIWGWNNILLDFGDEYKDSKKSNSAVVKHI